jgi:hypothetical protein
MNRDYDRACYDAAEGQGLAEPTLRLASAGYAPFIEQTGGFCMCLRVDAGPSLGREHEPPDGSWVWVTREGPGLYLACLYPFDKADDEADPMPEASRQCEFLGEDLVAGVRAFLTGDPHWDGEVWHHPADGHVLTFDECEAFNLDGTLRDR